MDFDSVAFHAAEPGHLAFGKLVDGVTKAYCHLLVVVLAQYKFRNKLIFKSIVDKVVGLDAFQKAADLFYQPFPEPIFQADVYPADAFFSGNQRTYIIYALRKPLRRQPVSLVKLVPASDGLYVKSGSAAQDGDGSASADRVPGIGKRLLVLVDIEFFPGGDYIYKVVGDIPVFRQVLSCADIHSPVHLPGIGREDFRIPQGLCKGNGITRFSGRRGPKDAYEVVFSVAQGIGKVGYVYLLRLRHGCHGRDSRPVRQKLCPVHAAKLTNTGKNRKKAYLCNAMPKAKSSIQVKNRRASYDYEFLETYTAGIRLVGTEIKSIRAGKVSLQDAYCFFSGGELYVRGMNIAQYHWGSWGQHEPVRDRKLLLNRRELRHLLAEDKKKGLTIVAVRLFISEGGYAKLVIALAKGKHEYDKRESIKAKDVRREMERNGY